MKNSQFFKHGMALVITAALSGCNTTKSEDVRAASFNDLITLDRPGRTTAALRAEELERLKESGKTAAEAEAILSKRNVSDPQVWFDKNGKEVGPVYFDTKTKSIVPNNRDGDKSNDAGVSFASTGFVPECFPNCVSDYVNLAPVADDLVAKKSATYTGAGEFKYNNSSEKSYTAVTKDTLTANFDNGTIGGTSVHKGGSVVAGADVTVQLANGIIEGRSFDGNMEIVDSPGGYVVDQEGGDFKGILSADGATATGTGRGRSSFVDPVSQMAGGGYDLKFNVTEKK